MKNFKILWLILSFLVVTTTIASADFDMVNPRCNSNFHLRHGSGSTLCTDTSTAHSYWTYGNAHNTSNTRLTVEIRNASGAVVATGSSTQRSTYASAWWTRSSKTTHGHRARSMFIPPIS